MVQFISMPQYQPSPLLDLSPLAQGLQMRQKAQQAEAQRAMAERQMAEQQRQFGLTNQLAQNADQRATDLAPFQRDKMAAEAEEARRKAALGGEQPSNVREWNVFSRMSPEDQQRYLTMKRAEKYLDTGTGYVRPNPIDPMRPTAVVDKNLTAAEVQKGEGKNIAEKRAEAPEAKTRLNLVVGGLTRMRQTAESLARQPGLGNVVGGLPQAYIPNVRQPSIDAQTELENLKVQISGTVLQSMRDMSKTGGAVGQVTEREWPRLENMLANLDPRQGQEQFMRNLRSVQDYSRQVESALREAYEADQKVASRGAGFQQAQPPQGPSAAPRIQGADDYNRLPPGTVYIDPNGVQRTKR